MPDTPGPDMVTVDVTMFADPIKVPADEVPVLRSQGLLRQKAPTDAEPPAGGAKTTTKKDGAP
jgi:hypothetical protein